MSKLEEQTETEVLTSGMGDGPEDPYLVMSSKTRQWQTGNFVLRPAREREAFEALKLFCEKLNSRDSRKEPLRKWLERLERFWDGK